MTAMQLNLQTKAAVKTKQHFICNIIIFHESREEGTLRDSRSCLPSIYNRICCDGSPFRVISVLACFPALLNSDPLRHNGDKVAGKTSR